MIVPSIDLQQNEVVQLIGGRDHALSAGAPAPWLKKFNIAGEVAVVDLDAALGTGNQRDTIAALCANGECRVGGGIRDYETARWWLDHGASKIMIGTAAEPALLRRLPRERVIAALDARDGDVVVNGWRTATGRRVVDRIAELRDVVGGFLVTLVEREGKLDGTDIEMARSVVAAAGDNRVTIAGGITTAEEVTALDRMSADAQVGMALYTDRLSLANAIAAPLRSDRPDGFYPTVIVDEHGTALGLAWSSAESIREAVATASGVYQSRNRGIWVKGATSGNRQELLRIDLDCDRDTLRFTVRQRGAGFCHRNTATCWDDGPPLSVLERTIAARIRSSTAESYTHRLLSNPALLGAKLLEEAAELGEAASTAQVAEEAADLIYFAMVQMARHGVALSEVERTLARRSLAVSRRGGDAKPGALS